jgi:hypothetical protein
MKENDDKSQTSLVHNIHYILYPNLWLFFSEYGIL